MFCVLPVLLAGDGVAAIVRLRKIAIMIVVALPLVLVCPIRLSGRGCSCDSWDIEPRMIATVIVSLAEHFEHFVSPCARQTQSWRHRMEVRPHGRSLTVFPLGAPWIETRADRYVGIAFHYARQDGSLAPGFFENYLDSKFRAWSGSLMAI